MRTSVKVLGGLVFVPILAGICYRLIIGEAVNWIRVIYLSVFFIFVLRDLNKDGSYLKEWGHKVVDKVKCVFSRQK
jgi:hypothetical protein